MAENDKMYHVHGRVTGEHGHAVHPAEVVVWWQHIRDRRALARGGTEENGRYELRYEVPEHLRNKMLVVVEAVSPHLPKPLTSDLLDAQPNLKVDLAAEAPDTSEWATLVEQIRPLLENLELTDLVESDEHKDLSFLARELNRSTEEIMRVAVAVRIASAHTPIPAEIFWAFLRQRIPVALPKSLLDASQGFTMIDSLVQHVASLILSLTPEAETSALTAATAMNLINEGLTSEITRLVSELQAQRSTDMLQQPYLIGKATLGQLLNVVQLPQAKQTAFAQAMTTNTQSMRNFWRTLSDGQHGFTPSEASAIERTLSIGAFVKNHLPLVQVLVQRFSSGTYTQNSDLARLSLQDWIGLVNQVGPPPSIDAAGTTPPAEVFARVIYSRVTRAFPTVALASRVMTAFIPPPQRAPLNQVFLNNPNLNLIKNNLTVYFEQAGAAAWTGISNDQRPQVLDNLKRMQRVLFLTRNADSASVLLGVGLHSATQIAAMGLQQFFLQATQAGVSKVEANQIYRTSQQRYSGVVALYTNFNRDAIGVWPRAIGLLSDLDQPIAQVVQRDQSLATLFGSQDYCETDFCTSILSPAAYLCDLLYWLRSRQTAGVSALSVLDGRRPDIRHLLLNCPNTDTQLPYIDLVNEILADAISPPSDPTSTINPPWKQTTADQTALTLRATPQYFNQGAFVTLFGASYPHTLPYSAGLDELRACLQQSGAPLWQLRQALLPLHSPTTAQQAAVAAERFGMAPHEVDLVANANFVTANVAWNVPSPQNPSVVLAAVPALLQAASISYESLLELLQSSWVQGGIGLALAGVDDTCDTTTQSLSPSPIDPGLLDRAHRFLRMWRRTGYKIWELDLLLGASAVASGTLNAQGLAAIFAFRRLQDATKLPVDAQLAFFQDIDTISHRDPDGWTTSSLYARTFLGPSVPVDSDLKQLIQSSPSISDTNLSDHLPALQAALGMSARDAQLLFAVFGLAAANTLTIPNLSLLYRVATLARAAKLAIADLAALAQLLAPSETQANAIKDLFANCAATQTFLRQVTAIQQSGFTIDALTYLLTLPPWTTATGMTDADIATTLAAVRNAILNPSGGGVNGSVVAAMALNAHHGNDPAIANDVSATIMQQLEVSGTAQTLLAVLTDPSLTAQTGGNFTPITRANFPNQFLAVQLFDKVATVVRGLHLVNADFSWLLANTAVYGGIDFSQLPVASTQVALAVEPLLVTVLLVKLARLFTAAPPSSAIQTLYDVIGGVQSGAIVNEASAQAALSTITGWPIADITVLAGALGVVVPDDYKTPTTYDALRTLEAMATKTGGSGAQLVSWCAVPSDEPTAENMAASALGVLKSRYSNSDWLAFAPKLMDPLRENHSVALQAWLIGQRDAGGNLVYGDTNGLFDHFLIDTQMSSCEVTTRVIQAYIAVQIFVERCRMNLESPGVVVDPSIDDAWNQWEWMKRFRIWQANREVFLYPENWLIESQRPNRTENYKTLEQEVHQGQSTSDYLETVVLNYIDRLEQVSHLIVTGMCEDPATGAIYVVARSEADPPRFYMRSYVDGEWNGWSQIHLDIKAHQVVPTVYAGHVCLFWLDLKLNNEPHQNLPAAEQSSSAPSQEVAKYATLTPYFSIFRNDAWTAMQTTRGTLFDKPPIDSFTINHPKSIEALYTIKVQTPTPSPGFGAALHIDIFRLGEYITVSSPALSEDWIIGTSETAATHIGRAVFDGRFEDLELRNSDVPSGDSATVLSFPVGPGAVGMLVHAQATYGEDAQPLVPLSDPDPDLVNEPGLMPRAGALATQPADPTQASGQTQPLTFTSVSALEQNVQPLLNTAPIPFRVVGPATDLNFDPTSSFFYQDNKRSYFVESQKLYWTGSAWLPNVPSSPSSTPFEMRYFFHRFYNIFPRLFWRQLSAGGFDLFYDRRLQLQPDQIDPSGADSFDFNGTYHPSPEVSWDREQRSDGTWHDEFLDFNANAAYGVYNWELFFHIPLYIAGLLSQNQQFEDALKWYQYIFNPTLPRDPTDPDDQVHQHFWIPKPLYNLTKPDVLAQRINNLLTLVNQGNADAVNQVMRWRQNPLNPFLLADMRPVAYMKRTVMSYLDNLIAWADNLFSSDSREALSEATLLYVIASEILGPQPQTIPPPQHADDSYDQLEPNLDAFANAMVAIENVMGPGGGGGAGGGGGGGPPPAQTFYFKIPPNDKLLGYWSTVADRLFKLRHCQNIQGQTRALALFDAPIDPGLLIKAQAAGVDIGSVLSDIQAPLPNYRFTALYPQALDFVNAVRAYGQLLQSALEKSDADQLATLLATKQLELQQAADQIFDWQVQLAQSNIDALNQNLALGQQKMNYNLDQSVDYPNTAEGVAISLQTASLALNYIEAVAMAISAGVHLIPDFNFGAAGFGGTPTAGAATGGKSAGDSTGKGAQAVKAIADALEKTAILCKDIGRYTHQSDDAFEKFVEASMDVDHTRTQIAGATLQLQIAQQNQTNHQLQEDQIQQQIDFLTDKFTNQDLYDWMVGQLADTYFQSYRLAYRLCKQVERCYQFELGIPDSNFIQFGYWDSLHKGLLAGEALNQDLRRMQSSYLDKNARRFELSRFVSLSAANPNALVQLLDMGACDFDLPESLFDNDYPGHYNRRLLRVSVTVVYPSPGKFDNVKATLTMLHNKVRVSPQATSASDYQETASDPRFVYDYAAVPQKIVLGNAQDDPGLFLTALNNNLTDTRYLPFENAGAVSSWHLEMPGENNEIDLSTVGDVVLHLYYTALDGGDALKGFVQQYNESNFPTTGVKLFSARNDFPAPVATNASPFPNTPWDAVFVTPSGTDQALVLTPLSAKLPAWTRGKTITVAGITVLALGLKAGGFVLEPQAPLTQSPADVTMTPVAGTTDPLVYSATLTVPPGTTLDKAWSFKIRTTAASDFQSLKKPDIGDILLLVAYQVS